MIKDLLTSLKMKGALEVLKDIDHLKDRDQFLIALLKAEMEDPEAVCALRLNHRNRVQLLSYLSEPFGWSLARTNH